MYDLAFGSTPCRMLMVFHFGKHCSCHILSQFFSSPLFMTTRPQKIKLSQPQGLPPIEQHPAVCVIHSWLPHQLTAPPPDLYKIIQNTPEYCNCNIFQNRTPSTFCVVYPQKLKSYITSE
jgi:hypothetical protein